VTVMRVPAAFARTMRDRPAVYRLQAMLVGMPNVAPLPLVTIW
jgi:hypothetical protein